MKRLLVGKMTGNKVTYLTDKGLVVKKCSSEIHTGAKEPKSVACSGG